MGVRFGLDRGVKLVISIAVDVKLFYVRFIYMILKGKIFGLRRVSIDIRRMNFCSVIRFFWE